MTEEEKWRLFHSYYRLVEEGVLEPLKCALCDNKFVTRIGVHDELRLWCAQCDIKVKPGFDIINTVKARVSEWIL